jgi:Zn-dependent protease with chaperone function
MKSKEGATGSQPQQEEYAKKRNSANFFLGLVLVFSWLPEVVLFQAPIFAISLSVLVASVGVFLSSYSQLRIDRRYKRVTATEKDYLVLNLPFYLMALVPGLALLGFKYMLPKFGVLTAVYADGLLVIGYLFSARLPAALRLGQRAVAITDESVLSSFSGLANKMGVSHVNLYSIDWKKFKIANAFQAGPSKFSVFVSNYLLENMTNEEVNAVMAHELAHAKRKHVMKISGLLLFTSIIGMDLFVVAATLSQTSIWPVITIIAGFVVLFLGSQLVLRLQRKFELEADEIAVRTIGEGGPLVSALQKLVELNLVSADRKSGTHPSVAKRIQRIEQIGNMPREQHNKIEDTVVS